MQSTKYHVACFCSFKRQSNCLQVSHLTDKNYIRILTQGTAKRLVKPKGVSMNLPLIYQALFAFMYKLNRIFDGKNMLIAGVVNVVQHSG